jgi:chromosome segregation ATPase
LTAQAASRPAAVFLKEQSVAGQRAQAVSCSQPELHDSQSEPKTGGSKQLWTGAVDQLFAAAFDELRRQAEQQLRSLEKRRIAEVSELSQAVRKQHGIIETLKRELAQAKEGTAVKLAEAEEKWQRSEAERMSAARRAWELEKEELTREMHHQHSIAEQLADQLAALKAASESRTSQLSELKKIAGEIDRCLLLARSEWQSEVAKLEAAGWELPSCLKEPGPSTSS